MEHSSARLIETKSKENEPAESLSKLQDEQIRLEARIYTLEKESQMFANFLLLTCVIGGYFLARWYVRNLSSVDVVLG